MLTYRIKLSKFLSYVLRHAPERFGLELDRYGFGPLEDVLHILKKRFRNFKKEDLFDLVRDDQKGRFQIVHGRIRAVYGHSITVIPRSGNVTPPETLYHGTSAASADRILRDGLMPMGRQFVHLSVSDEDARMVGKRHDESPVILEITAGEASLGGVEFWKEGKLFLAKRIPAEYIRKRP